MKKNGGIKRIFIVYKLTHSHRCEIYSDDEEGRKAITIALYLERVGQGKNPRELYSDS